MALPNRSIGLPETPLYPYTFPRPDKKKEKKWKVGPVARISADPEIGQPQRSIRPGAQDRAVLQTAAIRECSAAMEMRRFFPASLRQNRTT
jgi:hypothetical protein